MPEVLLPTPHRGWQRIRRELRRFNWIVAGRRWQKTSGIASLAAERATMRPGYVAFWGAPVFDQVRHGWTELRKMASELADFNEGRMEARFFNGARIVFRSLDDPDNARGHTADDVYLDEMATIKGRAWPEVLRPMLLDTGGGLVAGGTPNGLNWLWREWERATVLDDSRAFTAPTLGVDIVDGQLVRAPHPLENPNVPFGELVSLFRTMTEARFRQEIMAQFVDSGDLVFKEADVRALPNGWLGWQEPRHGHRYLTAVDIGRRQDRTEILTVDYTTEPYQHVAHDRFVGVPYPEIQRRIGERVRAYGGVLVVESNGPGDPVIENLDVRATPFVTTARSKVQAIEALQLLLEAHQFKSGDDELVRQLRTYEWSDRDLVQDAVMAAAIAAVHLPAPNRRAEPAHYEDVELDLGGGTVMGPMGREF